MAGEGQLSIEVASLLIRPHWHPPKSDSLAVLLLPVKPRLLATAPESMFSQVKVRYLPGVFAHMTSHVRLD